MSTPGTMVRAAGLTIMLISASVGMNSGAGGGFGLILSFAGVVAGANLVAVGVRVADDDPAAPIVPALFDGARALAAFLRRRLAALGLVLASSAAVAAVSGEAGPLLCLAMFALLQLGLSLITIGALAQ